MLRFITEAVSTLALSIASMLFVPTVVLLLLRRFMPAVGNPLWQGYCQLLGWLIVAPIRLIRMLVREVRGRQNP